MTTKMNEDELKEVSHKLERLKERKKAHKRQKRKEKIKNIKHSIKSGAQKAGTFLKEQGHNAKETVHEKWSAFRSSAKERYNQYINAQMVIRDQENEIERMREEIHNLQNQLINRDTGDVMSGDLDMNGHKQDNEPIFIDEEESEDVSED